MLKYLHIENIAVIERSDIEFNPGFNVLTGETGAGKSIVIDSINAVMGERTSKDLIRAGCSEAEVSALFGELPEDAVKILSENGITPDEDGNILVARKLSTSGKGIIKINGKPLTAGLLREISSDLINIHGQHDSQALLNPDKHCGFIDAVAENEREISEYYAEFKNLNRIRKELLNLQTDEDEKQHKIDLLKYQIDELGKADIKAGEVAELKAKLKIAENYESTLKALNTVSLLLSGSEESDGAISELKSAAKQLSVLDEDQFGAYLSKMNTIIDEAQEISTYVTGFLSGNEFTSFTPDSINERLDLLYKLMLKYGDSEEKMLSFLESAEKELETIKVSDERIKELSDMLEKSKLRLIELGNRLTDTRKKAAHEFEIKVADVLRELNMPSVKFIVKIDQGRYTKSGRDIVEFLISANVGEQPKPLAKIASGGELSRIMLAIKSALLGKDSVGTMIFDEIDTGISGYAADKVAVQLKKVSVNRQVICVTHLAQIAARADNHLLIEKSVKNARTFTKVYSLGYDERINEIARIMSGTDITENMYNSAKELLDRSK